MVKSVETKEELPRKTKLSSKAVKKSFIVDMVSIEQNIEKDILSIDIIKRYSKCSRLPRKSIEEFMESGFSVKRFVNEIQTDNIQIEHIKFNRFMTINNLEEYTYLLLLEILYIKDKQKYPEIFKTKDSKLHIYLRERDIINSLLILLNKTNNPYIK